MQTALNEINLVFFTTLAPAGVIAFIVMSIGAIFSKDNAKARSISHFLIIPLCLCILGLIISATHLGNPANAMYVTTGIGRSPLSNEVVSSVIFLVLGGVYWIVSYAKKLPRVLRIIWLAVACISGIVFVQFVAVAYSIFSVPTWNLATVPVILWFCAISTGILVSFVGFVFSKADVKPAASIVMLVIAVVAAIVTAILLAVQWQQYDTISNTLVNACDLVPPLGGVLAGYLVLDLIAVALVAIAALAKPLNVRDESGNATGSGRGGKIALIIIGAVLALAAYFIVRFAFYMSYMTFGI
ncbi:MAG: dimethyl sulfoxide reductase anchor subunit [Eggerthellaceae bacterium]|nr:dimethyl sulfoxide reductase anchor subunit [Eggerthellaceae bacterium]